MKKTTTWLENLLRGMGEALFHPFQNKIPPAIGCQPFRDQPYKKRGLA